MSEEKEPKKEKGGSAILFILGLLLAIMGILVSNSGINGIINGGM